MKAKGLLLSLLFLTGCDNSGSAISFTREEMINACSDVADFMKEIATDGTQKNKKCKYELTDETSTLQSMVALIKFAGNMYENENFIVSDKFVSFEVTVSEEDTLPMYFVNQSNIEENKFIASLVVGNTPSSTVESGLLLYFDIDYNFETEEISGFEIRQIEWQEEYDYANLHFKYEEGLFYCFAPVVEEPQVDEESQSIIDETVRIKNELRQLASEEVLQINYNFGEEYANAMSYAFA